MNLKTIAGVIFGLMVGVGGTVQYLTWPLYCMVPASYVKFPNYGTEQLIGPFLFLFGLCGLIALALDNWGIFREDVEKTKD